MKTLLLTLAVFLGLTQFSFAGVDINCTPSQALKEPLRVGWDSLLSVKSFSFHMDLVQPTGTAKMIATANDSFNNSTTEITQEFTTDLRGGQVLDLQSSRSDFYLKFDKVLFSITNIDAPMTVGPMPEGTFPATAALVLVSSYRTNSGADGRHELATLNIPLACSYTVAYRAPLAQ
ncbi:MAG: hypothetical protein ACXWQO_06200 [Bdellovibrionota bacterium]